MVERPKTVLNLRKLDSIKHRKIIYPALFIISFLCLFLIFTWNYFPSQSFKEGIIADRDILAPRNFEVEDKQATEDAVNQAMNSVEPVYIIDENAFTKTEEKLKSQFSIFISLQEKKQSDHPLAVKELKSQLPISISDESLRFFLSLESANLRELETLTLNLALHIQKTMPIPENDEKMLKDARQAVRDNAKGLNLPENDKTAVAELASESIRPNAKIDWDETYIKRQRKKDQVKPVMTLIKKGQVIVEKGKIVTPQMVYILEEMGIQRSRINFPAVAGMLFFVVLSILLIYAYIKQFIPELALNPKLLLLLIIIGITNIVLCKILGGINPFWTPVPLAVILATVLINPRVALIITVYMSMVVGLFTGDVVSVAVTIITGLASVLSAYRVHRRMDLITASIIIFFINELTILIFSLIYGTTAQNILEDLVYGGINGFSSGIVAVGLLPILEYLFDVTTVIKLLELSSQSEPLMKRLLLEAPGTYHHSVIVGNLAEAAAAAVNAPPLLCRVASYYHDIGKLRRPYFFIENQLGGENPHDNLSPNLSALVILSHIKDGIDLAKKHRLPEPIIDIISQHHGNSIIQYFYHQARMSDNSNPAEEDFRYPGPRPQTKASAIVMMADSVEAAARTLDKHTPAKIENLVRQVIEKHIQDGQLSESPLSLRNIEEIIQAFVMILTGIYHQRIEYPEKIMEEIENEDARQRK